MSTLTSAPRTGATHRRHQVVHHGGWWARLSAAGTRWATLSWQTVGMALLLASGWDVVGMAVFGDQVYSSPSYDLARHAPGGMRSYAVALSLLLVFVAYGYGQHRVGRGRRLRLGLSLLAGWHVGWLAMLAATYAMAWQIHSWRALGVSGFIAFVAVLVARATPPDRR